MQVDLIMPLESFLAIAPDVIRDRQPPAHYRITGSLGRLLQNEGLFNLLQKGVLTMQMDKSTLERSGLPGNTRLVNGQHIWTVSLDLNPANRHCDGEAHKQRERFLSTYKSITTEELNWLLCHETGSSLTLDLGNEINVTQCTAELQIYQSTASPPSTLKSSPSSWIESSKRDIQEIGLYMYEWLSLFRLESPRVRHGDSIDPFLSRYHVANSEPTDICRISWVGLIGATWFQNLVRDVFAGHPAEGWLLFSSNSFHGVSPSRTGSELMVLRPSTKEDQYLMWRMNGFV
ncbi:hypothetical protein E4U41_006245 [Claviceps citrina]|nr:hypothetical protein E4U41_006245 [Claviceps citrina]